MYFREYYMANLKETFKGKTVLITGHTGFKGSWLSLWLHTLGAKVIGVSIDIPTEPSNYKACKMDELIDSFELDIRDYEGLKSIIHNSKPDFVFHLAAQPLVRESYNSPLETFSVNAIGSANILESLREYKKRIHVIMITSDKAYDNVEWVWGYKETDRLGGKDPYSASKGMAELIIKSYYHSYYHDSNSNVRIGIARAGNVIGGGDWASDRIVADCMRSWSKDKVVEIRNPNATRPWQHVLEPLSGYLSLAMEIYASNCLHGEAYNFGPPADQDFSVKSLIEEMSLSWENVRWKDISKDYSHLHEAGLLKLNCDKALFDLEWLPTMDFVETVKMTIDWYKAFYGSSGIAMKDFSIAQIEEYSNLAIKRDRSWANC